MFELESISSVSTDRQVGHIGGQPADSSTFGDRPEMGGADIVAHRDEAKLFASRISVVHLLAFGLFRILKDDSMILPDIVASFACHIFRHRKGLRKA